jgi:hypothetical protein
MKVSITTDVAGALVDVSFAPDAAPELLPQAVTSSDPVTRAPMSTRRPLRTRVEMADMADLLYS